MTKTIETKTQYVYEFIKEFDKEYGYPPTVRDICKGLNIKSTASVYGYLNYLVENGYLNKENKKTRALILNNNRNTKSTVDVKLLGKISAGIPITSVENEEDEFAFSSNLFGKDDLFLLKVQGDSMINAGILDGDLVVIKKTSYAKNGEIVAAQIDDEATIKRYFKIDDKLVLKAENPAYQDIICKNLTILGIVSGVIRNKIK